MAMEVNELEFEAQRHKYRDLLEELQDKADSSGAHGVDPDALRLLMMQGNDLWSRVKRPREAALDAQFMKQVSQLASLNIRSTHASLHEFKPQEFAVKMKTFLARDQRPDRDMTDDDFKKTGGLSNLSFRLCRGIEPLLTGFVSKAPKAPVARQQRPKDKESTKTEMKQVASAQGEEVQTEEVSRIYAVLKKRFKENGHQPICFFTFVVNPESFVLTIENVFHTSFLIRDQHALITEDANRLPVIAPDKPTPGQQSSASQQIEVSFDVNTFQECIQLFNIKQSMIPPRPGVIGL